MDAPSFARIEFNRLIKSMGPTEVDPVLKNMLMNGNHPRLNLFLKNLSKELAQMMGKKKKSGRLVTREDLRWLVKEMTKVFILTIEAQKNKMYESDNARLERERKKQEIADMDATLEGKPQGIFEEMGVITDEKTLGPSRDQKTPTI